ncbi:MAG TPA: glutathione S-transferase [Psychromonas sp.]
MKIYGSYTSPFVRHCRIVLLQTKLACEFIETNFVQSAQLSPTKKVPMLVDGDLTLTDSSSIINYLRQKAGGNFFQDIKDFDLFCLADTLLDTTVNIFLLRTMDNIQIADSKYLQRQSERVLSGLGALNKLDLSTELPLKDGFLRLACFLDWALYRDLIDISKLSNLTKFLALAKTDSDFVSTAPPAL